MREAVHRIDAIALPVVARSRVYETAPVGNVDQPAFLNAAVAVSWSGAPEELRRRCSPSRRRSGASVESVGRRGRSISTCCGSRVSWSRATLLDVPHPSADPERAFAVVPLLDVVPDAFDPAVGRADRRARVRRERAACDRSHALGGSAKARDNLHFSSVRSRCRVRAENITRSTQIDPVVGMRAARIVRFSARNDTCWFRDACGALKIPRPSKPRIVQPEADGRRCRRAPREAHRRRADGVARTGGGDRRAAANDAPVPR